jgi:hypothetical protein
MALLPGCPPPAPTPFPGHRSVRIINVKPSTEDFEKYYMYPWRKDLPIRPSRVLSTLVPHCLYGIKSIISSDIGVIVADMQIEIEITVFVQQVPINRLLS